MSRKKRLFDELCEEERLTDTEQNFKHQFTTHALTLSLVTRRPSGWFGGIKAIVNRFRCVHPCALLTEDDDILIVYTNTLRICQQPMIRTYQLTSQAIVILS